MSIANQITRITNARNTIRSKLVDWGLVGSTATVDDCAEALDSALLIKKTVVPNESTQIITAKNLNQYTLYEASDSYITDTTSYILAPLLDSELTAKILPHVPYSVSGVITIKNTSDSVLSTITISGTYKRTGSKNLPYTATGNIVSSVTFDAVANRIRVSCTSSGTRRLYITNDIVFTEIDYYEALTDGITASRASGTTKTVSIDSSWLSNGDIIRVCGSGGEYANNTTTYTYFAEEFSWDGASHSITVAKGTVTVTASQVTLAFGGGSNDSCSIAVYRYFPFNDSLALSQVTVNPIPDNYINKDTDLGSLTVTPSVSSQYFNGYDTTLATINSLSTTTSYSDSYTFVYTSLSSYLFAEGDQLYISGVLYASMDDYTITFDSTFVLAWSDVYIGGTTKTICDIPCTISGTGSSKVMRVVLWKAGTNDTRFGVFREYMSGGYSIVATTLVKIYKKSTDGYSAVTVNPIDELNVLKPWVERTGYISTITASYSTIGPGAFMFCSRLTSVNFPSATAIGSYAFYSCSKLEYISAPNNITLANLAFAQCVKLQSVSFSKVGIIGGSCFQGCASLSTVSFQSVSVINGSAFMSCFALRSAYFPSLVSLYGYAFAYCSSLSTFSAPLVTSIYNNVFYSCISLQTVYLQNLKSLGGAAFSNCYELRNITLTSLISIGAGAFYNCYKLTLAHFNNLENISQSVFRNCSSLVNVSLPLLKVLGSYTFAGCIGLSALSLPRLSEMYNYAFVGCTNLMSLYLMGSSVVVLKTYASNVFSSCPIYVSSNGVYGSIYVPASLYSSYKTATNWTAISERFVSV